MNPSQPARSRASAFDIALFSLGALAVFAPGAHAYLDPGSGSYAVQVALAGLFGAIFAGKVALRRMLRRFAPRRPTAQSEAKDGARDDR